MRMGISLLAVAMLTVVLPLGSATNSVDDLVRTLREGNQRAESDASLARALHRLNLNLRLDDRTAEELESEAPGPKSIAELERLRDLSHDMPLPAVLPWFASPPTPTMDELRGVLTEARRKALTYTESLPDFICTETVRRYETITGWKDWSLKDTLTLQLTYFDREESYKLTAMNGHKTGLTYEEVGGASSKGEFGSMLLSVFALESEAAFRWSNWTTLRKRPTYVLSFRIEARNSHYRLAVGRYAGAEASITPGEHGLVYIDRETKDVMRLDSDADSIPADFPLKGATRTLDYGMADVGGRDFLLPLRAEVRMMPRDRPLQTRNLVEFGDYRKFTGESTISFGDPAPAAPPTKK